MQSEISEYHEDMMNWERVKEALSWQLAFETDESKIEILSARLNIVITRGIMVMQVIDAISEQN